MYFEILYWAITDLTFGDLLGQSHSFIILNVTLSHLRSKEITSIHKPCIPHSTDSRAITKCKLVCIQM